MTAPIPPLPVAALVGIQQAGERAGWDDPCPHDSLSGDEGPVADLGRMPIWWRCDSCDAVLLLTADEPPTCDCLMDPHHRWNCALTPIWAQTIRESGCNPWTVTESAMFQIQTSRINRGFQWDGEVGRYCGKGPCCMFDGHDGRCRM